MFDDAINSDASDCGACQKCVDRLVTLVGCASEGALTVEHDLFPIPASDTAMA